MVGEQAYLSHVQSQYYEKSWLNGEFCGYTSRKPDYLQILKLE